MNLRVLKFATLSSPLARSQTQTVIDHIEAQLEGVSCRMDALSSPVSASTRAEATFLALCPAEITCLEEQLLSGAADLLVVEAADVMMPLPEGLAVICVPPRATPFDAYLNRQGLIMDEMDPGSRVGVMSMRSRCQMAALWPDLSFRIMRGGVDQAMETHLRKSDIDGLVLPAAVTENLGIQGIVAEIFAPEFILPSPGQGTLAVIGRADDEAGRALLAELHSIPTALAMAAEQSFCSCMVSDQDLPVGALAEVSKHQLHMVGGTGACSNRIVVSGDLDEAEVVGMGLAQQILCSGESLADLLEAEFPDGLPDDIGEPDDDDVVDEDAAILEDLAFNERRAGGGAALDNDALDLDDLEHLKALEDLAGIGGEPHHGARDDGEDEDDSYD